MKSARKHGVTGLGLTAYVVLFYGIWTMWELWGKSLISARIESEALSQFIKSGVVKNLVWTFPAIVLIQWYKSDVYIPLKEMLSTRVNWLKILPVLIVFTIYILAGSILNNGELKMVDDVGLNEAIIVLFVGLTEEMVFRGWLLNVTIREDRKWIPIMINAIMFLAIHFPKWICTGVFIDSFIRLQFLELILLGVVFSCAFIKSRSILVPIALHMYWDLLVFMFI